MTTLKFGCRVAILVEASGLEIQGFDLIMLLILGKPQNLK